MLGETVSQYRIGAELGRGGMGVVYRAHDQRLRRDVALKLLPAELSADEAARERLLEEARTASQLNHPHICVIHEVGEAQGRVYIAMELVEGRPLAGMIPAEGLPPESVTRYGIQLADALAHAHQRRVIHRDLKSSNVMVTPEGRAKILDFGLARQLRPEEREEATRSQQSLESAGGLAGTLAYMPPEVLRGDEPDAPGDLWALGVVLYEMASGRLPFEGRTGFALSGAILQQSPPPLPEKTGAGLRAIILRCLEKNPGQRYQSAGEVRSALEALQSDRGATVQAVASLPVVAGKRRWVVASLSAVALVLIASAAFDVGRLRSRFFGVATLPKIESLAVLPLRNVSGQAADEYLGIGIADTIITKVSQLGKLTVRPSSAVRRYATQEVDALEAARQLRVDAVLDGTVQRAGDRLRVNLNLLRVSDGGSIWSESFNVSMGDVFSMQDEVARNVVAGLRLHLTSGEHALLAKRNTSNPEAYDYYLRGMYNLDKRTLNPERRSSVEAAIVMFKKAIELDPNYALAHAQLAYAYAWMALFIEPGPSFLNLAREQLRRAETLDPELAVSYVVRHELLWSAYEGFQLEASARALLRAQQLDPSVGREQLGVLYAHMGLEEAALREVRRAIDIDPTSELNISRYVEVFDLMCRPQEAIAANLQYGELPGPTSYLRKTYIWAGQFDKAQRLNERMLAGNPEDPQAVSAQALIRALHGDFRSLDAIAAQVSAKGRTSRAFHHMAYNLASIYALRKDAGAAIKWLRETVDFGMPNYTLFSRDPHLDPIRSDPLFVEFMSEQKQRLEFYQREFGN